MNKLSIITINRNNAIGLEKTIRSVLSQTNTDFEYVIIDGASTDDSVKVIRKYASSFDKRLKWVSEPDKGIYNAMNKGLGFASGKYVEFLNSGDCLVGESVIGRVCSQLGDMPILYGNLLKDMPGKSIHRDKGFEGKEITFLDFYTGTLNHSSAFIRRDLFEQYGLYDESLKIVSDWKWFMQVIVFGNEKPVYTDIDVSLFDMNGISETQHHLTQKERKRVLEECINPSILSDYRQWAYSIRKMQRIQRHALANKLVCFIERCLFKMEMM